MLDRETITTSAPIQDYRLPETVKPERYEIRLVPDLKAFTFTGEEIIQVHVNAPTDRIVLNALELEIGETTAEGGGETMIGEAETDEALERAALTFSHALKPGPWRLRIAFRGILNDKLHGFYRSFYKDSVGNTHIVAATQFEATDARRAFPCWDEPALKAIYKITLVIDGNLTAISNTAIERERLLGDGKKEIVFRDTIRMSTYLIAFVIGKFVATDPVDVGEIPLRVVHVPGKHDLTRWALEIGAFSIRWFSNYYGIRYPGDKLDLIAIPDFASGAMENLGAITFRETALLIDEKTASRAELERVADVVSHENAHMWFGDLVTMRWWNGIWLNEAFATFMEMLAVDAWKPQWKRWVSFGVSRSSAMAIDGLSSTRPIEYMVHSPNDARAMFDVLTYEKGASVLRMLEQYLGAEDFRKGISQYLRKHEYDNTETGDLWDALEQCCGQPVRKMMDTWIFQPGFPIVEAAVSEGGRALSLRQRRFLYLAAPESERQSWHVPLIIRVRTDRGLSHHKLLLTQRDSKLELPDKIHWAIVNEGGHGFYRCRYSSELLAALAGSLEEIEPIERFALVSDTWAATVAGLSPLSEFLKLARLLREENELVVWRAMLGAFNYLDMVIQDADRPILATGVRKLAHPAATRLGWAPAAGEEELRSQLRGVLIGALGTLGDDSEIQRIANRLYANYRDDPSSVHRDVVPALISVLAHCGDEAQYREFKENFKSARTPQEEQRYLFSLAGFRRPELLRQTMAMTINGEARTQNAPYLMHALLANPICRDEAWRFLKDNWELMEKRYPESAIPRMCEAVVGLLDHENDVIQFFAAHKVKQAGKTIDQHLERLHVAVQFRKREGAALARNLSA